jgi:hypothetical protein
MGKNWHYIARKYFRVSVFTYIQLVALQMRTVSAAREGGQTVLHDSMELLIDPNDVS